MIIDLFSLETSPYRFSHSIPASEIDMESEPIRLSGDVLIEGELMKKIAQTDIEGQVIAEAQVECSRCLKKIEKELRIPFSVIYVTPENYTEEKESELKDQELDVAVFEGASIDLVELAREQIILHYPEQVFCREDCKGFCQKCGANRNLIDCNCEENEVDPRWAALKKLK